MKTAIAILILASLAFGETIKDKQIVSNVAIATWDANTESDLSHYVVHVQYGSKVELVQTPETSIVLNLYELWPEDSFYENVRFNVTAFDQSGNESLPSETKSHLFAKSKTLKGDYNQDGVVLADDIMRMNGALGSSSNDFNFFKTADVNGDGVILADDIMISRGNLGQTL